MIIKTVSFVFENPSDGKVSVSGTNLIFDSKEEIEHIDDEGLLQMIREMGINAIRIVQPDENVIAVSFGNDEVE